VKAFGLGQRCLLALGVFSGRRRASLAERVRASADLFFVPRRILAVKMFSPCFLGTRSFIWDAALRNEILKMEVVCHFFLAAPFGRGRVFERS